MIVIDFWKVKIVLYFQFFFEMDSFFKILIFLMFSEHAFKFFTLAIIHVDFMRFPFRIPCVIHHNKKH
jgi:hypothetical protein